jgi:hypothetical protein
MNIVLMIRRRLQFVLNCLAFLLLLGFTQASAQICKPFDFNLAPNYQIGENPFAYTSADFNADGNTDVAVVNVQVNKFSILKGDGNGGFLPARVYTLSSSATAIAAADLNSDNKIDLIVGTSDLNKIAIYINDGQGGFLAPSVISPPNTFTQYYSFKTGDFNGDGKADLVASVNQQNKQLKIFLGDGQGNLNLTTTIAVAGDEATLAVGNINGDNIQDIVVAGGSAFVSRYISYIYGSPSANFAISFGFNVEEIAVGIKIVDLNNDSKNDLALAFLDQTTPTEHYIQPRFNDGFGSFTAGTKINLTYAFPPSDITTGDFTGDGIPDLGVALGSNGTSGMMAMVIPGRGDGNFLPARYWSIPPSRWMFADDANHDGKMDLIAIQGLFSSNNTISVLINKNNGFNAPPVILWGPNYIDAADFNNDNRKDLVSSWFTEFNQISTVDIAINDVTEELLETSGAETPAGLKMMKVGDFNGDGNADAVTAHTNNTAGKLGVYLGNGTGATGAAITTNVSAAFVNLIVGDFNNDGKDDVFAVDAGSRGFSMISNGNGTFSVAPNSPLTLQNSFLKLQKGDFNGDNKLDLIVSDGSVKLWLGDGTGQFTLSTVSIPSLGDVTVGDFNNDDKLDLAGFDAGNVKGLPGDGAGNFGQPFTVSITSTSQVRSLVNADFNLDGYDDLAYVTTLADTRNLVIVPGAQNGSWGAPIFYSVGGVGGYEAAIIATDFNGDNKPDIGFNTRASRGVIYNKSGATPCVSINDVTVTEGSGANVSANFAVTLSAASAQDVRVNYSLQGQSAAIGADVENVSGQLIIPAGQTSASISVAVAGDLIDEFDEIFTVNLSNPANASLQKSTGTGTIQDDDAEPTLTVADISANESQAFVFQVSLSAPSGKPISFRYTTADGTAVAGRDYGTMENTVNISQGASAANFQVFVTNENIHELNETFFVNFSNATNVTVSDTQAQATIVNDDQIPTLNFFGNSVQEGDTGTLNVVVSIQLSNPTYLPVTFNILTSDGTATSGRDYVASDTQVTIAAEQLTTTTTVQTLGDTINEPNETFNINVYNVSNATINIPQNSVSIFDDESIANDYDRDGKTDVAVFRPSDKTWYILYSQTGNFAALPYGLSDDIPVSGDYSGDGRTDLAVFRPSTGTWYTPIVNRTQQWGVAGDVPVHGDYDNDGRIDVAVFRPDTSSWYIRLSSNNSTVTVQWGVATDTPVPADYDGDGKTDVAVYRAETGVWYILRSTDGGYSAMQFGIATDKAVPADYDGDGRADVAVFRDGVWYVFRSSDNDVTVFQFGASGDKPVPGNYDGDNKTDFAVYRAGVWWIWLSSTGTYVTKQFGLADDIPIPFVSNN